MAFDWLVAVIVCVIIGLLSYFYHLHFRAKGDEIDIAGLAAPYDRELFAPHFPAKETYEAAKSGSGGSGETEPRDEMLDRVAHAVSGGGDSAEASRRKELTGLLLKRAIAAVQRAVSINTELENVRSLQASQLLRPAEVQFIQAGVQAVEAEHRDVASEANALRPGWGEVIFRQAADLSIGLQQRKQARKDKEAKESEPATSTTTTSTTPSSVGSTSGKSSKSVESREDAAKRAKEVKAADMAYRELMAEEERKGKKPGSKKGK